MILVLPAFAADPAWIARSKDGMVAADHPEASQIGADVLRQGGNAFDAAVATSLALGVCRPESTGLGGGGFMVAFDAKAQRFVALDFRETAPACATAERFAKLNAAREQESREKDAPSKGDPSKDVPSPSIYGGNAVAVPGLLAGLGEIHRRWGTRSWPELVRPAAELAERGLLIDDEFRKSCDEAVKDIERFAGFKDRFRPLANLLRTGGRPRAVNSRFVRQDLAVTLRMLAERGSRALYEGPIAEAIVKAVSDGDGCMTLGDLTGYKVKEREPLLCGYGEYAMVTMPPPSSGGICLAQIFAMLQQEPGGCGMLVAYSDGSSGSVSAGSYSGFLVECLKHSFADRARWIGDPDFAALPLDKLLNQERLKELGRKCALSSARPACEYGVAPIPERAGAKSPDDGGTSHFCIADRFGNVVSMTETINGGFGSFVVVEPYGIILNNEMDDFTTVEGVANLFGLVQGKANLVAPGKRPLSSMTPTIVLKDRKPFLALGGSGGPRIITSVVQVAHRVMNGMALEKALDQPRLHHQWQPDEVYLDRAPNDAWKETLAQLQRMGNKISDTHKGGVVQAIQFLEDGTMVGACDPKKGGRPAAP